MEETQRVRLHHLRQVQHPPQLRRSVGNPNRHDRFAGLRRGQQVRYRADAAYARGQARHLVEWPALAELLKTAHLRHVELRILDSTLVVEVDGDLAVPFKTRNGIDGDRLAHGANSES